MDFFKMAAGSHIGFDLDNIRPPTKCNWSEIFRGYDFTGGVEFPIFLLIFEWALQQCSVNALPVINAMVIFVK